MGIFEIIIISFLGIMVFISLGMCIYYSISIRFDIKNARKLFNHELWDGFIKLAEEGKFKYDEDYSVKGKYEVFVLRDRNNKRRYEFIKFDNASGIFTGLGKDHSCVLSSFNKEKAEKMYNILKTQVK